uniref:FH2 domain-containing protein n=1 Tax=Aegilops tauschii subsp. strangulata TaxID=200361 RepID=A0A453JWJ2_AEGTS
TFFARGKSPELLDFHEDLVSLEAASKLQLKALAEEQQAVVKGLEKVEQELTASETDGPVSDVFRKTLKEFLDDSGADVRALSALYADVVSLSCPSLLSLLIVYTSNLPTFDVQVLTG